jgi:hypothetical protein
MIGIQRGKYLGKPLGDPPRTAPSTSYAVPHVAPGSTVVILLHPARAVGAKVVDNHWINNPIFGLIDRTVCRLCRMRSGARPPRYARPSSKPSRRWQSLARTSYLRTTVSKASATTKTCREVSNQQRHAVTPGSSPSAWCATRMNLYVVFNRPIAHPCSNAPIPPMRSTRVATTPCSIQGCLGL